MICYLLQNLFSIFDFVCKVGLVYLLVFSFWFILGAVLLAPFVIAGLVCTAFNRFLEDVEKIKETKNKRPVPKIDKNLIYYKANEMGKRNIEFVYNSVSNWIFENIKDHPKKYLILEDNTGHFKQMIFQMDSITMSSNNPEWKWEYACDNEAIIKCLEARLHAIAKNISKQTNNKVEVPEELEQIVKSLFWSV